MIKSVTYVFSNNLQRLRFDKDVAKVYAPTFTGLSTFLRLYFIGMLSNVRLFTLLN